MTIIKVEGAITNTTQKQHLYMPPNPFTWNTPSTIWMSSVQSGGGSERYVGLVLVESGIGFGQELEHSND